MNTIKLRTGFTIVELLIVIVIIAILAAITIVAFNGIQQRARASEAVSALSQSKKKLEIYKVENGSYPLTGNLSASGISDGSVAYQYTSDGTTYCVTGTATTVSYKATESTAPSAGGCAGHGQGGSAAITNLVLNPSFETNSTSWYWANGDGYTGGVSTAVSNSGTRSFFITAGATVADRYLEAYVDNVPAGTYTYSAYVYLTGAGATYLNRQAWFHCSSGSCPALAEPSYNTGLLNQWQRVQKTQTVTATANFRIRFYGPANSTTYIDSIMVTSGSSTYPYKDGNSQDWIWNGTTNNSTSTGPSS